MRCLMAKYNNPRRTWKYSNDFKINIIQLSYVVGVTIKSAAEKLDIHPFMLSRWRKEYREEIIVADKRKKVAGQSKTKKYSPKNSNLSVKIKHSRRSCIS